MDLVERSVRNPTKVAVGVIFLVLFGAIAFVRMPVQLTPEVQTPVISVETRWPGASPQEVEREITQEQEEQLKGLEGMITMSSESSDSEAEVRLELAVGTYMPEALLRVNSRLQQVREYPVDADRPVIRTRDISGRSIGYFVLRPRVATDEQIAEFQTWHPRIASELDPARIAYNTGLRLKRLKEVAARHVEVEELLYEEVDMSLLRRFAENVVEARFERVPGVSSARVMGGREEELQVIVDPQRLAARRLTIVDMRRALQAENKDTSGGDFWEGKRRYVVRTISQFRSPEQVADVILARRDGVPVYVRDVAEVRLGHKKPTGLALRIGTSSLTLMCSRQTGANVLEVMRGLREAVAELNAGVLNERGLALEQVYDETDYIYSAIGLVRQNIFVGGSLTVIVLLLFLRSGRATVLVGVTIPICIIGTFLMLRLLGRSLNVISLAGLAFSVGMLVDNAVVVLENIYRHYQSGDSTVEAIVRGTREVWGAVVASTLTTLAVFLPVLFIQEEAGQLFRDIALAISSAVALSLIVSVIVIPTAAAKVLRRADKPIPPPDAAHPGNGNGLPRTDAAHDSSDGSQTVGAADRRRTGRLQFIDTLGGNFVSWVVAINARLQQGVPRRVGTAAGFIGGAILLSWLMMPEVEYLPTGNRNIVFGSLSLPPGYNLEKIKQIGQEIEEGLRPYWDLDLDSEEARSLPYPPIADYFFIARGREVFMGLRAVDPMRAKELVPLLRGLATQVPGAIGSARQSSLFSRRRGSGRAIDVEITGPDIEHLVKNLGTEIFRKVQAIMPRAQSRPIPSLDLSSPEVHILPKREEAAALGMSAEDIGYTVDCLVDGAKAGDYFLGADKIDLTIIGQNRFARHSADLESLPIATPTGQVVPLGTLSTVVLSSGPEQINHRERQRAITIEVSPPEDMPLGEAMSKIREGIIAPMLADGRLGGEYQVKLAGTADTLVQTWRALRWNLALAVLITYLLMAALFESWLYPLVIILSVPMGAVGGILGLNLLNVFLRVTGQGVQHLDVLTMLGFVILIGTVVNNAILIVHQSLNLMRQGQRQQQAVLESIRTRIRPIFMTTSTTVLGLLPLVLLPGAGSELYRGLGSVVLGGLVVSTMFTLILVPTLFTLVLEAHNFLRQRLRPAQRDTEVTPRTVRGRAELRKVH